MTEQEAIKIIEKDRDAKCDTLAALPEKERKKAVELNEMIEAQALAVIALEKQVAKKPVDISKNPKEWHIMSCPVCERAFWNSGQFMRYMPKWCEKCGQKIDWTVKE